MKSASTTVNAIVHLTSHSPSDSRDSQHKAQSLSGSLASLIYPLKQNYDPHIASPPSYNGKSSNSIPLPPHWPLFLGLQPPATRVSIHSGRHDDRLLDYSSSLANIDFSQSLTRSLLSWLAGPYKGYFSFRIGSS